jgi:hypothetical protein
VSEELQNSTNSEWYVNLQLRDVKTYIRDNINSVSRSFVAIGYYLKYIRDHELFTEDGYQNIWELAQVEFGIGKSSASRFMAINDRFSKDGNSPILLDQYKDFSSSKLSEMLTMTDEQLDQVSITTTVAEIREIKNPDKVVATSQQEEKPIKPITIDDLDLSVRTYNCLKRAGIDTIDQLCDLTEDEVIKIRAVSRKCLDEIKLKLSEIVRGLRPDIPEVVNDESKNVDIKPEIVNDVDETVSEDPEIVSEPIETVEADIIQADKEYDFDKTAAYELVDVLVAIQNHKYDLEQYKNTELDAPIVKQVQMELDAMKLLEESMRMYDVPKPVQPELPILKNNNQRKDWLDNYTAWPIWIDLKETGERYYRYDFDNGISFVIRVSLHHKFIGWDKGGYSKTETEYSMEEYFILGGPSRKWEAENKTFREGIRNKSAMVEFLKELQKN